MSEQPTDANLVLWRYALAPRAKFVLYHLVHDGRTLCGRDDAEHWQSPKWKPNVAYVCSVCKRAGRKRGWWDRD